MARTEDRLRRSTDDRDEASRSTRRRAPIGDPRTIGVINPQYPASWWQVAFSDEVRRNEVVPVRILERDLIVWRDATGALHCNDAHCAHLGANIGYGGVVIGDTVRCPFHGWCYDASGSVAARPGEEGRPATRAHLNAYRVLERYGGIFVWNGYDPPDHEFPDALGESGLAGKEVTFHHHAFRLPWSARWFIENAADGAHFSFVHHIGASSAAEIVAEPPTRLEWTVRQQNVASDFSWRNLHDIYRRGELSYLILVGGGADIVSRFVTYGAGITIITLANVDLDSDRRSFFDDTVLVTGMTPMTATSHRFNFTVITPKVKIPIIGPALERALGWILARRDYGGVMQDLPIMSYRKEPPNPPYSRQDRALVAFRRFWDSRIIDRSLWRGDVIHSGGLRAGIKWSGDGGSGTDTHEEGDL